jgi:hypothetical protein
MLAHDRLGAVRARIRKARDAIRAPDHPAAPDTERGRS